MDFSYAVLSKHGNFITGNGTISEQIIYYCKINNNV